MTNEETTELRRQLAKLDAELATTELVLEEHPDMHEAGIAEIHELVQSLMAAITEKQEQEGWI